MDENIDVKVVDYNAYREFDAMVDKFVKEKELCYSDVIVLLEKYKFETMNAWLGGLEE